MNGSTRPLPVPNQGRYDHRTITPIARLPAVTSDGLMVDQLGSGRLAPQLTELPPVVTRTG
jgi:hypothetical protein